MTSETSNYANFSILASEDECREVLQKFNDTDHDLSIEEFFDSQILSTDNSLSIIHLFRNLLLLESKVWEYSVYENTSLSKLGWGIQMTVLEYLDIPFIFPTPERFMETITKSLENSEDEILDDIIPESKDVVISKGIWIGLEEGVDTAILLLEINNIFLVIEGSPARPSSLLHQGNNRIEALEALNFRIADIQRDGDDED